MCTFVCFQRGPTLGVLQATTAPKAAVFHVSKPCSSISRIQTLQQSIYKQVFSWNRHNSSAKLLCCMTYIMCLFCLHPLIEMRVLECNASDGVNLNPIWKSVLNETLINCTISRTGWYNEFFFCFDPNCACAPDPNESWKREVLWHAVSSKIHSITTGSNCACANHSVFQIL